MKYFLILCLCFSSLLGQEAEVPPLITELEGDISGAKSQIEDLKNSASVDKSARELAEGLVEELELKLASLEEITAGGDSGKAAGTLLQEAFKQTKQIESGDVPYSVTEIEEGLQEHRIALVKLKQELSADPPEIPEEFSTADKAKAKSLVKDRAEIYDTLKTELERAIEHDESALDASEKVLKAAAELEAFVMPRIFWFRGADPVGGHTIDAITKEFYGARDEVWKLAEELSGESFKLLTVANVTIIIVLFGILPAIFLWTGKRLRAAVPEPGVKGRRRLLAFGMFVRSFFPGLFVFSFAFLIRSSSFPDDLLMVTTVLVLELSLALLVVMPVRSFCNVNGLGVRVFGLTPEVASWFRRFFTNASILFCLFVLLPSTLATQLENWSVIPFVGQFFFKIGVAVLTWVALRRSKAMAQYVMVTKGRTSFLWKNWNLICGLIVLVLIGTLVGDILGYRFASDSVFVSMMLTAFLGFVMFAFFKPAEAAALRLSRAHAIAWNEALTEEGAVQSEEGGEFAEKKTKEELEELDAASRDRTKALVRTLFLIFGLTTLISIWNTDGRLYYAFDQFTLFATEDSRFSLAGVFSAMLVLVVALSVARTLPAFFELFVFPRFDVDSGLRYAIVSITRYAFLTIVVFVVLNILQVNFASLGWLVAALGVGLGFGLQEIVSNFVSGVIILVERPIRVGDVVTVGGQTGAVSRINIRATTITNWDRLELIIPNKDFITKEVTNWTLSSALTRIVVPIGVAYGTDPERVKTLLLKIASEDQRVATEPAPMALFRSHGASSLDFELRVYVPELGNRVWVEDSLVSTINRVLTEEEIEIPFPQQDVYLHQVPDSLK